MKVFRLLPAAVIGALFVTACDDTMNNGTSLVDDKVEVIVDTTFKVTGHSISGEPVLSRTTTGLLGSVDAPYYGNISSDFVSQFMSARTMDTVGVTDKSIQSVKLIMRMEKQGYIGDSLAPMGLEVYRLTKQLPSPIYSDFDPAGYYDPKPLASQIYTASDASLSDSLLALQYREIVVNLPVELGRELFNEYKQNPAAFNEPESFASIFPGLYIKSSYGGGRLSRLVKTTIDFDYTSTVPLEGADRDTTYYKSNSYFAVTPEIIANNNISLTISDEIKRRVAEGQSIIVAPTGLNVEMKFPAAEILDTYHKNTANGLGVINTLTFTIPAEKIENKYDVSFPPYLLMVLKKDYDNFFSDNKLTDNVTSFYATYNETTNSYGFGSFLKYIQSLDGKEGGITDEDVTFVIAPVLVSLETNSDYYSGSTSYVTSITPYVAKPVMARLRLDNAKINFVYSSQSIKN